MAPPAIQLSAVLLFLAVAAASPVSALSEEALSECGGDSICLVAGAVAPAEIPSGAPIPASGGAQPGVSSGALGGATGGMSMNTVRDVVSQARETFSESALRTGAWCKGLENNNIQKYELVSGQPMQSWEEVLAMVSQKTGVKAEYLCVLLWMESRGNAYSVGADGECGAFQTMPQFYGNYADYCARYGGDYAFVAKTCAREKWDDYPFNVYPKAELGFDNPLSCFHPLNSATAGAIEFGRKLKAANGDVRGAFRRYNGAGAQAEAYADKAFSRLQKVYDSPVG